MTIPLNLHSLSVPTLLTLPVFFLWNSRELEEKSVREAANKAFIQALKQDFGMFFVVSVLGVLFIAFKWFFGTG